MSVVYVQARHLERLEKETWSLYTVQPDTHNLKLQISRWILAFLKSILVCAGCASQQKWYHDGQFVVMPVCGYAHVMFEWERNW